MIRERSAPLLVGVGAFGCFLSLLVGVAAASSHAKLVAGALIAVLFCGIAITVYFRDPIGALIGLWLIVIFNAPISGAVGYDSSAGEAVRQSLEILVLLFLCLTIWRTMRTDTRIPPLRFILPGIGIAVFGLLGAAVHDVPLKVAMTGAWLGLKLWIMIGITLVLPWKPDDLGRVYRIITRVGVLVAVLGLADDLTHGSISHALGTSNYQFNSERFRGESVRSIFPQPGEFSVFMSLLFGFAFARFANNRKMSDLMLALLFAGSIMLSLRLKGFLSLAAVLIIVAFAQGLAKNRGTAGVLLVGVLLFVGVYSVEGNIVAERASTFTSSETTARAKLYITGERIATKHFPLGVGFGRFASYPSRIYYSPIYQEYELNRLWGLSRAYPKFIDDTSWPAVIGETGYGGLAIWLIGITIIILAVIRNLRAATPATRWAPLATLCAIAALLVNSLGAATLFDWVAITTLAMILGPTLIATRDYPQMNSGLRHL